MNLYEQLKDDLGYLQMGAAAERFALLAEEAGIEGWSHVEYLARVVGEQAAATRNRRLTARLRYARFPYRRSIDDFDFEFQPSVDPNSSRTSPPCGSSTRTVRSCFSDSPAVGRRIWRWRWPPARSKLATGAISAPPTTCAANSQPP